MAETLQITVHARQAGRAFGVAGEALLESVRELEKAHRIIRLALNVMDAATKARWFDGITAAGATGGNQTDAMFLGEFARLVITQRDAAKADAARVQGADNAR